MRWRNSSVDRWTPCAERPLRRRLPIDRGLTPGCVSGRGPGRRSGTETVDLSRGTVVAAERDLPMPDYDHLPVGSLTSRIRSLDADDLTTLLDYEREHANRIQ